MKQTFMAISALFLMLIVGNAANAQTKIGYFDLEYMVSVMPGIGKVDTALSVFQRDSLGAEYNARYEKFTKDEETLRKDSATMPPRLYQEQKQKLIQDFYLIQNWQAYSQQMLQGKQQELLAPFYQKISDAFQKVVTENKYTHVFKAESFLIAPPADNLIPLVAKKLGVKLPEETRPVQR